MASHVPPPDEDGPGHVYDPADFLVAPSDARGVSYRLTFRLMPDMDKAIEQILQSKRFPFSTKGDVMRYCLREGLRKLERLEPVVSVTKRVDLVNALLAEESAHAEFMAMFTHLDETISKYLADQSPQQALRVIAVTRHHIEQMPEGYWRDRYLKALAERYGKYVTGAGTLPLPAVTGPPKALGPKPTVTLGPAAHIPPDAIDADGED